MVRQFYLMFGFLFAVIFTGAFFWPPVLWSLAVFGPLFLIGMVDSLQTRHGVRRNFPIFGNFRYLFEMIRPELQQYFVESNLSGRPIPREYRSIVYQRAKGDLQTQPFGTQRDVYEENHEWVNHSIVPKHLESKDFPVLIGKDKCAQPYRASRMNISAMSYGSLSPNAITALNQGAKIGGFYHNTGEGGLSPYHLQGGDVVWQIGTGYFGCRTEEGEFSAEKFREKATRAEVKMVEIKLSQGAKPGKGGILPASKVTQEIALIRGVPVGKDVVSPPYHTAFYTPMELLQFISKLRELSGGKPVGIKLCIGKKSEFMALCKAMLRTGEHPDFITVDGAEGGTGAAPLEFANSVGTPLEEGLIYVVDTLRGFGLRDKITVIASGKVLTSFHMLTKIALGADIVNSARGMMLALGCIQALKCNSNHCPVGVATTDPKLARGLVVSQKNQRVANFHRETLKALIDVVGAMGYDSPGQVQREDIYRRLSDGVIRSYEELFPSMEEGALLRENALPPLPEDVLRAYRHSTADSFLPPPAESRPPLQSIV
jgi:glutamate synthase domain-containing protein 2